MILKVLSDSICVETHHAKSIMCFDMYRTGHTFSIMRLDIYDTKSIIRLHHVEKHDAKSITCFDMYRTSPYFY